MTVETTIAEGVATVTLNQPNKRNAISLAMREQLWTTFENLAEIDAVRAVVLTGAGEHFCAGVDVTEMGERSPATSMMRMRKLHRVARAIAGLNKPVIAAVDGVCVGAGWSYALACDMVVCTDRARFAQIFRNIGLTPDAGAAWLLSRQIGMMRAKEIVYSGRMVHADEALALGLVLERVSPDQLAERTQALAASFAASPTLALGMAKRQFGIASASSFDQFLEAEFAMQPVMSQTEDHREGVDAFREKRPPMFGGR
ncbi:enoyl-CoA hydratase/isomerase family protein [Novosphingobium lindaniclasticum]|uniref:Enoyl-CoA hydratase n=1 Tax=Novosphingobium lindaniclasticum LE124 TaxID=1096930 RepID=T0IR31_9SPHN|nr:enoyl-CoA hydratase-related protein [Novosphingobium lindaniclasticum]EQB14290.1 hypothetical protein L284_12915 [Novosphingobium lindaniclasticum LE124]